MKDAATMKALVDSAATLIRSGFAPEAALHAVGLQPIEHTGKEPVTVRTPSTEGGSSIGHTDQK